MPNFRVTFSYGPTKERNCVVEAMDSELAAMSALIQRKLPMEFSRRDGKPIFWNDVPIDHTPEIIDAHILTWGTEDDVGSVDFHAEKVVD